MTPTMNDPTFNYNTFRSLHGADLVEYMEPLLYDSATIVAREDLEQLSADIESYDEHHILYAIIFGMLRTPEIFTALAVECLSHKQQSVRLAAYRQLLWLSPKMISDDLIKECHLAIESARCDDVKDIAERLRRRRCEWG